MGGRTHKCPIVENPHTTCSGEGGSIGLHETQRSHFYFLTICCWSSRAKDTQTETKIQLCLTRNNRSQIKCAACQVSLFSTEWWKCFENAWGAGQRKPLSLAPGNRRILCQATSEHKWTQKALDRNCLRCISSCGPLETSVSNKPINLKASEKIFPFHDNLTRLQSRAYFLSDGRQAVQNWRVKLQLSVMGGLRQKVDSCKVEIHSGQSGGGWFTWNP